MKKWVCTVCGYVYEGEEPPAECPVCHAPAEKFEEVTDEIDIQLTAEHVVGVASEAEKEIVDDIRANYEGECAEVGMYYAMARVAEREGYPEVGLYYEEAANDEAIHAAKFAELIGECVSDSTKKNLEARVKGENGASNSKYDLAERAKEAGLDAVSDTVHEIAKDEARHCRAFKGLLDRYFS